MINLHIEHPVPDFDAWKVAFDRDPVGREKSGVRCYRITQPVDNPNYAIIDLEFDTLEQAEGLLAAMQEVWKRVGGTIMQDPQWCISEMIESHTY